MNIQYKHHSNTDRLTPPDLLLKAIGDMNVDFELWCEDSYAPDRPHWAFDNYRINGTIGEGASHLFYTQPGWGKYFADKMGKNKVKLLTYAVDEDIYPLVESKKIYDVGFIGNVNENDGREEYLDLLNANFKAFISTDTPTRDIAKELSKCKVVFNQIRFEEINIRFFEALACGAQVVSYSPALHMFAEEGKHYLTYKTPEEAVEKITYLLNNDKIRETMAIEARKHVLANHTYKHRVKEIVDFL